MPKRLLVLMIFSLVLAAGPAEADKVDLANGDRLTGRCLSLDQGKLVFETDYSGKLTNDWSRVTGLSLDQPMVIDPGDGKPIRATMKPIEAGKVRLMRDQGDREVALSGLRSIAPGPKSVFSWQGEINLGAGLQQGNTDNRNLDLDRPDRSAGGAATVSSSERRATGANPGARIRPTATWAGWNTTGF